MARLTHGLLFLAFLLAESGTVIAQMHKCTDAQGKVSYGDKPCAGAGAAPAARPAPSPQTPAPAKTSAKPKGPDEAANYCAEQWVGVRMQVRSARSDAEGARSESDRLRYLNREKDASRMFRQGCGGFGFVPTDSPDGVAANDRTARKIANDYRVAYDRRLEDETRARLTEKPPAQPQPTASAATASAATVPAATVPASGSAKPIMSSDEQFERDWCANEWENQVAYKRDIVLFRARHSAASKAQAERDDKEIQKNVMKNVLARCGKYGMVFPSDAAAERKNDQVAQRLRKEVADAAVAERAVEIDRRVAADAESRAREERSRRAECDKMWAQLDAERGKLSGFNPQERAVVEKGIVDAERSIRRECPR
jgi:hypothetical protein